MNTRLPFFVKSMAVEQIGLCQAGNSVLLPDCAHNESQSVSLSFGFSETGMATTSTVVIGELPVLVLPWDRATNSRR